MRQFKTRSSRKLGLIAAAAIPVSLCASIEAAVWHVDDDGPGGDGTDWLHAMNDLQDALGVAVAGDLIKVAQGTYKPGGAQSDSFDIPLEVVMEGGYAGVTELDPDVRNIRLYVTILSGDIDDNDLNSPAEDPGDIVGSNSFHVLTIVDTDLRPPGFPGTVVDGVTITAGNANGLLDIQRVGGGAFVADLAILELPLSDGPEFRSCTFVGNRSEEVGGALACADVGVEVRDCLILNNETLGGQFSLPFVPVLPIFGGGGISGVAPFALVNSRIIGNLCAGWGGGGGVAVESSHPDAETVLASCFFAGNRALEEIVGEDHLGGQGGGATMNGGEVMNCVFTGNLADFGEPEGTHIAGGGLHGTADVYLSSFYGNDAPEGNGGGVAFVSGNSSITNSIAWGNTDSDGNDWSQQIFSATGICPTWSNIQGWTCGQCVECNLHNICADPYFIDPDGADNILGTADDNLRLRLDSPSIDKGSDAFPLNVPKDSGDVNDNNNPDEELPWDLARNLRKFDAGVDTGNIIDQGAYEVRCPACPWDLNGDRTVGVGDMLILLQNWGASCHHANFLEPDTVGQEDLNAMTAHWGDCQPCPTGGPS